MPDPASMPSSASASGVAGSGEPLLRAAGIVVERAGRRLLDGVSLSLAAGRILALLGPNGAGKSTLLRVLSGEWQAAAGEVRLAGRPLPFWKTAELGRRRAFLHQETHLDFAFTVEEVVRLGRIPHAPEVETPRDIEVAHAALAAMEMDDLAARAYTTLSGGEKQRVHLARVLAQVWEPDSAADTGARLLLLDEPANNLDLAHQHATLRCMRTMAARGLTVIAVLHDLNLALRYADAALLLDHGRVAAAGPVAQVLHPASLEPVFGVRVEILAGAGGPVLATY